MAKNLKMKSARAALDMSQDALSLHDALPILCISICRALGKTLDELFWTEEETK